MSYSFGCRVNEAERQSFDQQLVTAGFSWNEKNPSFYIINSCAVTGKAEREVRQHIYHIRKKFPNTILITTGCSATLWKREQNTPSGSDYFLDNAEKETLVDLVLSLSKQATTVNLKQKIPDKFLTSGRMMIKIQEGCNRFCSYCIVPYLRGPLRSSTIFDIVKHILSSKEHVSEVILTAINTEGFGKDTGETLPQLIETILKNTKVERVSFGSIHPWSLTDTFLPWYQQHTSDPRFVHFFHIPVQSGSDKILNLMGRQYNTANILGILKKLRSLNPHALIATDVIVGFPGETKKEFEETYLFLKNSPIDKFHIFRYSKRPGTTASVYGKKYREPLSEEKIRRANRLLVLGKKKYSAFLKTHVVHVFPALFLAAHTEKFQEALLDNQVPIRVRTKAVSPGTIQLVHVDSFRKNLLFGSVVR